MMLLVVSSSEKSWQNWTTGGGSFRGKQNLDELGKTGLDDYICCCVRTVAISLSWTICASLDQH